MTPLSSAAFLGKLTPTLLPSSSGWGGGAAPALRLLRLICQMVPNPTPGPQLRMLGPGSSPVVQQVKDPTRSVWWLRSLLWCGCNPYPSTSKAMAKRTLRLAGEGVAADPLGVGACGRRPLSDPI